MAVRARVVRVRSTNERKSDENIDSQYLIQSHYVPTGDVLVGSRVVRGFRLFDVAANETLFDLNSTACGKIVSVLHLEESDDFGVRVYLNEGRAI
jgi:hypothetical protein